jgi:hypothetical protein
MPPEREQTGITDIRVPNQSGYLTNVASPAAIEEAHSKEMAEVLEADVPDIIDPLVGFFQAIVDENVQHRQTESIDDQLIDCEERVQSKYSTTKLAEIREFGGSEIYMGLTGVKVRAAESWMKEILTTDREQLWRIEPTPLVDIPKDLADQMADTAVKRIRQLQAEAKEAQQPLELTPAMIYDLSATVRDEVLAERRKMADTASARMEQVIHDQLVQMDFEKIFRGAISDVCRSKAAIIKGPIAVRKKCRVWKLDAAGVPQMGSTEATVPMVFRTDPQDFYPSPVSGEEISGNTVERVSYERGDLAALRDQPGWSTEALNRILDNFDNTQQTLTYSSESDELRNINQTNENFFKTSATGWEIYAETPGQKLLDFGFKLDRDGETALDPRGSYDVNSILIDSEIVYLDFNPDEFGGRPYSASGWGDITGSFWSEAIAELMQDLQDMCNGSARALGNNMAFASGPQSVINDIGRIPDGEELTSPSPLKMWQFTNVGKATGKPLEFFQPDSNAAELLAVYGHFAKLADDYTGIPAYAYGNDKVAGAGRTASGLSMLMSSAARGIKNVILNLDERVLNKIIKDLYYYNIKYLDDPLLKYGADINVRATGAIQVMIKETMAQRRLEFLQATTNDLDFKVIGAENRANLLREIATTLDLDSNPVQTKEQISAMIQQDAQEAAQRREVELAELQREAEKDEAEMALKAAETALAYAKAETEKEQNQQKLDQEAGGGGETA